MPISPRTTRYHGVYKASKTTYKYVLDLDRTPAGKRRQESRGGYQTAQDAHEDRIKRLAELHRGVNVDPSRATVAEYLTGWLQVRRQSVRPSSALIYRANIDKRIVPHIGTHLLAKLAPSHIRAWHAALATTHSATSVGQAHMVLSMALGDAVDDGALARNVARLVTPPPADTAEKPAWSVDEVARFLAVADHDDEACFWRVALLVGLRRGELFALRWSDVDLKARTLTVRHTVTVDERGHRMIGPAKSESSHATLMLDASCVAALTKQSARVKRMELRAPAWLPNDLVFPRHDGGTLWGNTLNARLARLCAAAGVPVVTLHGLRHSTASALYEIGYDLRYISQHLRHANIAITSKVYVHLSQDQQRRAAELLGEAIAVAGKRRSADAS